MAIAGYNFYENGVKLNSSLLPTPNYNRTGLGQGVSGTCYFTAVDTAGNESAPGEQGSFLTLTASANIDPPTGIVISSIRPFEALTTWDASNDADVVGYNVYLDGSKVNPSPIQKPSLKIDDLTELTNYAIRVSAVDNQGNESNLSPAQNFTTLESTLAVSWIQNQETIDLGQGSLRLASQTKNTSWGAFARSSRAITGNNSISFKASQIRELTIGVGNSLRSLSGNDGINQLLINIQVNSSGFHVKEGITSKTGDIPYDHNKEITLRFNNGVATVEYDGNVVYTSPLTFTYPLVPVAYIHRRTAATQVIGARFENISNLQERFPVSDYRIALNLGVDTAKDGFYYFRPYLASELPLFNCDKQYLFFYSTDHHPNVGGLYCGKGNNLDLTDFEELGLIIEGYQAETPSVVQRPASETGLAQDEIFIYYHTDSTEPGNGNMQQTRLITTVGGAEPHLCQYTDRGRPLGIVGTDNHTGYFDGYRRGPNDNIALHIGRGGLPQPWHRSVSTDGLTYTREALIETIQGIEPNFFFKPGEGTYFTYLGQRWWFGPIEPTQSAPSNIDRNHAIIAKCGPTEFDSVVQLHRVMDTINRFKLHVEGDVAHLYGTPATDLKGLIYCKYDLRRLVEHL